MKKPRASSFVLSFAFVLTHTMAADARPIVGDWEGILDPGAQAKKRIVVHISAAQDGTLSGTIDYPDPDTSGILIAASTYKEPTLHFESNPSQSVYHGTMNKDNTEITGTLKQTGFPHHRGIALHPEPCVVAFSHSLCHEPPSCF